MVYTTSASFSAVSGITVDDITGPLSTVQFDELEELSRAWINGKLQLTADMDPVPTIIKHATNCYIWAMALLQQGGVNAIEAGIAVNVQEIDFDQASLGATNRELRQLAEEKFNKALEYLGINEVIPSLRADEGAW